MGNPEEIEVVSFDADGTLWDLQKVMRHSLRFGLDELIEARPSAKDELTIEQMIEIREQVAASLKGTVVRLEDVRLSAFRETVSRVGPEDEELSRRLNETYLRHRFGDIELFEDVLETLALLERKYVLGLLSNGNSYPEKCGLDGRFKFVVFAQDYGVEKPDPELFAIAVQEAGCEPQSFLHVGDSLSDDIAGARTAGVRSVWLNRNRVSNDTGLRPDFQIKSLLELPELLEKNRPEIG